MPGHTVVLVHGAFADASGFAGVIRELESAGHTALAPPNPLRGGRDQPPQRLGHRRPAHHMQRPQRPGPEDQRPPEPGIPSRMTCQLPGKVADHGSKDVLG